MKKYICSLLVLFNVWVAHAQTSPQLYRKVIPGNASVHQVFAWPDRSLLHVGEGIFGEGMIMLTDSDANVQYHTSFNVGDPFVSPQTAFFDALPLNDTMFYAVGEAYDTTTSTLGGLVMKANKQAQPVWSRRLDISGYHLNFFACDQTADSGIVAAGRRIPFSGGTIGEVVVARYDVTGTLLWSYVYTGGNSYNFCHDIKSTPDGGCVVTGYYEDFPPFSSYAFLMKLDANGVLQWAKKYNELPTGNFTSGSEVDVLADGYLIYGVSGFQNIFIRTDQSGGILWTKGLNLNGGGSGFGQIEFNGNRLVNASSGGYLVTSLTDYYSSVARVDTGGNPLWTFTAFLRLYDALETANHEWHLTGGGPIFGVLPPPPDPQKNTGFGFDSEIGVIQTDSNGYLPTFCYFASSSLVSPINISEQSYTPTSSAAGTDHAASLLSSTLQLIPVDTCISVYGSVSELGEPVPLKVYPNPAAESCTIEAPKLSDYQLTLFDVNGRTQLQKIFSGTSCQINLQTLAPGFYYCLLFDKFGNAYQGRINVVR